MSLAARRRLVREVRTIFVKEFREVLRDRRAAACAFILPLALYPALFFILQRVESWDRQHDGELRVTLEGDSDRFEAFLEEGEEAHGLLVVAPELAHAQALRSGAVDAWLEFLDGEGDGSARRVEIHYDGALERSQAARREIAEALERYRLHLQSELVFGAHQGRHAAELVRAVPRDVSDVRRRGELALARLLPPLLILLLLTGGAFAAIDTIAGEKERGTLETLLVHPVDSASIGIAKFLVILLCSLASVVLNLAGMTGALALGLGPSEGVFAEVSLPPASAILVVASLLAPLAVLSTSALLWLSSRSSSFRQAQTFLIPLLVGGLLCASLASLPNVPLNGATVWIPIANVSLAVREALGGHLGWAPMARTLAATALYATLGVRHAAGLFRNEETLLGHADGRSSAPAALRASRRAALFGAACLLFLYYFAPLVQRPEGPFGIEGGLLVTLWVGVLVPCLLYPLVTRQCFVSSWALRAPPWKDFALVVVFAAPLAVLVSAYLQAQNHWLPFSDELRRSMETYFDVRSFSLLTVVFVFCISPAICEEVLWRGVVQSDLQREGKPWKAILVVAVFFGLFHFSVYRLVPTAIVGAALAFVRWRCSSILPCVLLHALYNGLVVFVLSGILEDDAFARKVVYHPATLVAAGGVAFLALRRLGPQGEAH